MTAKKSTPTEVAPFEEPTTPPVTGLALLRVPFPPHQISTLPRPLSKDAKKGQCRECGQWHGLPAVHLSYVGHAALTDRLLDADPSWNWEPVADPAEAGLPTAPGGMWIVLTVCGVSRYGYGSAEGKQGGDAIKELIGDALRNAAMRFGAALELWHKGQLHLPEEEGDDAPEEHAPQPSAPEGFDEWFLDMEATADEGTQALQRAWTQSEYAFRAHLVQTNKDSWDKLKAKADKVPF